MDQKRKNIIMVVAALLVTNLITHYVSSETDAILGKKTTKVVASVNGKEFTSNDMFNEWKSSNEEQNAITALLSTVDSYILDDKYGDDKDIEKEVEDNIKQMKASYESQGQDFAAALESSGMSEDDLKDLYRDQIRIEKETKEYVASIVTKDQVQEAYDADIPKERSSQILFKIEPNESEALEVTENNAKAKAETVKAELDAAMASSDDKNATFAEFAKEHSEDENSKTNGGDIGFSNSEDTEYQTALGKLEVGEYSEVVKTSYGYSIIMKTDVQEKKSLDDKEVYKKYEAQVADELIEANKTYSEMALIELRADYKLKFEDTDLGTQYSLVIEQTKTALDSANETE